MVTARTIRSKLLTSALEKLDTSIDTVSGCWLGGWVGGWVDWLLGSFARQHGKDKTLKLLT